MDLSYQEKQEALFNKIEDQFKKGKSPSTLVESVSDYQNDPRRCLTSVVFAPPKIEDVILKKIIEPLKKVDPNQYYYVPGSFHLTIQNVRVSDFPIRFSEDDIEKARTVFQKVIAKHRAFNFEIGGLFELPTSLGLRAFSTKDLFNLASDLRGKLKNAGLPDDKKYASGDVIFGNMTICRYTSQPNDSFLREIRKLKNVEVGKFTVSKVSLITTSSICHPTQTKIIEEFDLKAD